jgi:hypothetical protein
VYYIYMESAVAVVVSEFGKIKETFLIDGDC